jgi:uncharacterized protein
MKRRMAGSCIIAAIIVGLCCGGACAAEPLRLATGQPGGFFWIMGKELCRIWGTGGLPAEAVETAGDRENVALVATGKADIALVSGIVLADYLAEHPGSPIVTVASCWKSVVHVILAKGLIKTGSISDLEGRKLYLGPEADPNGDAARRILAALGIRPHRFTRDMADTELLAVMTDFVKRELDGAVIIGPVPEPMVRDIINGAGGTMRLVPADETAISALTGAGLPLFLSTIPADSYAYQPDPVEVIAQGIYLIARSDLPGETAVRLSGDIFDNAGRIAAYFPQGETLSAGDAAAHPVAPMHPALK